MKEILIKYNEWWTTGKIDKNRIGIRRGQYLDKISKFISSREILKLAGVRRCGKTTLMYQLIDSLLNNGIDPKNICYLQLDDEELALYDKKTLIKRITEEHQEISGKNIEKDNVYFFLDEIQYIENWESWLKTLYDRYEKIKFVISGSSSMLIEKDSVEKLTGRQINFIIYPLSFSEFLQFNGITTKIDKKIFEISIKDLERIELVSKKNEIKILLARFLNSGGFPQVAYKNEEERNIILRQYFKDIIYRDIIRSFEVRGVEQLENLATYLLKHIGGKFNFTNLSNIFKISTDTAIEYFSLLTKSFLFYEVKYYSTSLKSTMRKERKAYCIDIGLRNAIITEKEEGALMENAVFIDLTKNFDRIFYWGNKHECDFIVKTYENILPIEVKYSEEMRIDGLLEFMSKFSLKRGIVVTKDLLEEKQMEGKKILFIPAWLFLLIE